jgi:hypothetical protein
MIEELSVFGDYKRINQLIDRYLQLDTTFALCHEVLKRWSRDYETDEPGLVHNLTSLLLASRGGLPQEDLLSLLKPSIDGLPIAYLSPILLASSEIFTLEGATIRLDHEEMRRAVACSCEKVLRQEAHRRIVDFYEGWARGVVVWAVSPKNEPKLRDVRRRVDLRYARLAYELPWQYLHLNNLSALYELLGDLTNLERVYSWHKEDCIRYWQTLCEQNYELAEAYCDIVRYPRGADYNDVNGFGADYTFWPCQRGPGSQNMDSPPGAGR